MKKRLFLAPLAVLTATLLTGAANASTVGTQNKLVANEPAQVTNVENVSSATVASQNSGDPFAFTLQTSGANTIMADHFSHSSHASHASHSSHYSSYSTE